MSRSNLLKQGMLIAALSIPLLAACSDKAFAPFDWKEEIQLHDGRKVIAERVDTYGGPREMAQTEPNTKERTIRFADPTDPKKTYSHKITGTSNYLMLDFHEGKPWLVVFVGPFSTDTKCPIGTYDTYAWDGAQWVQRSFKDRPKELVRPNMAVSYLSDHQTSGQPDLRRKSQLLTKIAIESLAKEKARRGDLDEITKFVDKGGNGYPTDCDHYRKLAEGKKP
jgi:hypothetical protein